MDTLRELLSSVKEGETLFRPNGDSKENLEDFQLIAKNLIYAHKKGYIEECKAVHESRTVNRLYSAVYLRGGLTYEGEQYLNQNHATLHNKITPKPSNNEDFIDIKPNFFGVGININAIWRRFRQKK